MIHWKGARVDVDRFPGKPAIVLFEKHTEDVTQGGEIQVRTTKGKKVNGT
jgi:hypothetical protein